MTEPSAPVPVTDVAEVEKRLAEFWRQASNAEQALMRACTANLVVACRDDEDVMVATRVIARFSELRPARALVVSVSPGEDGPASRDGLRAYVSAHCHRGPAGAQVCSEQITLEARGDAVDLVPETILQLLAEDTPVYAWWRRDRLRADSLWEPLARLCDRLIIDSASFPDPVEALRDLAALAAHREWRGSAGDLAWVRLEPWREATASFFDSGLTRRYLNTISKVEVTAGGPLTRRGVNAAGAYLVGWLASRLVWRPDDLGVLRRTDGGRVSVRFGCEERLGAGEIGSVRLEAPRGTPAATFVFERESPESDAVGLRMETDGTCPLPYRHRLSKLDDVALLCGELERGAADPLFNEALVAASRVARSVADPFRS